MPCHLSCELSHRRAESLITPPYDPCAATMLHLPNGLQTGLDGPGWWQVLSRCDVDGPQVSNRVHGGSETADYLPSAAIIGDVITAFRLLSLSTGLRHDL